MKEKLERLALWTFRIVAIPYSIWWFCRSVRMIYQGEFEGSSAIAIPLTLGLPCLLFASVFQSVPPWKNSGVRIVVSTILILILLLALWFGIAFALLPLKQILGETLTGILIYVLFFAVVLLITEGFPNLWKRYFKK
jgi:hypothetical protein